MTSVDGELEERRINDGYIDDVDNLGDAPVTNRAPECLEQIIHSAQTWSTLVLIFGQLLGLHKGGITMLAYMAIGGYMMVAYRRDIEGDFKIKNSHGIPTSINFIPPNKANKSLGFHTNCLGTMDDEYKYRLQQLKGIASKLLPGASSAKLALKTRILPSITYPFAVTSFTATQLYNLLIQYSPRWVLAVK